MRGRARRRRTTATFGVIGALAFLSLLLAAPALAASPASAATSPSVLAPNPARVIGAKKVTVKVRGGDRVRVLVNSDDVTRRFRRSKRGILRARLVRGRDFRIGLNRIVVVDDRRRPRRFAARVFRAARPARMLTVRRVKDEDRLAPVELVATSTRPLARLLVAVNGRRVIQSRLLDRTARSARLRLGANDGLRYGRNAIVVQAVAAGGRRFSRLTRRLRVPRTAPLPGAGSDRRAAVGRVLALDAGGSRRAARGDRLGFHWRIVSAPPGSKASLRGAGTARPRLVPDRRGRYQLAVRTFKRRPAGAAVAAAATPAATDVMTVEAAPPTPPLGVPIETLTAGGISLAGQTLPAAPGWAQVVIIDRSTLAVKSNQTIAPEPTGAVGPNSLTSLRSALGRADPSDLVVVSGGGRAVPFSSLQAMIEFGATFAALGAGPSALSLSSGGQQALEDGAWSVIGVPGSAAGSAATNFGGEVTGGLGNALPPGAPGSLQGYLQYSPPPIDPADSSLSGGYTFVSADHAQIDTQAPAASETVSSIAVGGRTFTTAPIPPGAAGFHLLLLNDRLEAIGDRMFVTNEPGGGTNLSGIEGLAGALSAIVNGQVQPSLVVMQSVGAPSGRGPFWVADAGIAAYPWSTQTTIAAEPLVGNEYSAWFEPSVGFSLAAGVGWLAGPAAHDQFAQMVSTGIAPSPPYAGGYTLVAAPGKPEAAVSQSAVGSRLESAQVVGTLTRNRTSAWQVENPAASDAFAEAEVMDVAYQPATAWPQSGTAPLRRASAYLAEQLGLATPGVTDVRQAYYVHDTDDWLALADELRGIDYPGSGNGFGRQEFEALKKQLLIEFPHVASVRSAVEEWQSVFNRSGRSGLVDLQYITTQVEAEIDQDIASKQASLDGALVAAHSLGIAAGIFGAAGIAPVAGSLGAISSSLLLASDLSQGQGGSLSTLPVRAEAAKLGVELALRYEQINENLSHVGDILVSDWGKLQTAAKAVNGTWAVSETAKSELSRALTVSADREAFTAMLPLAYGEYLLAPVSTEKNDTPVNEPWNYRCTNSDFYSGNTEPLSQSNGNPSSWIAFPFEVPGDNERGFSARLQPRVMAIQGTFRTETEGSGTRVVTEPRVLPPTLGNHLFRPLEAGGLGLDQVAFFGNPRFPRWPLFC